MTAARLELRPNVRRFRGYQLSHRGDRLFFRLVDLPAGVTQEEGHTGYLNLPSAVLALIFLARRIQPFLSLVDREVEFCVLTNQSFSTCWAFFIFYL